MGLLSGIESQTRLALPHTPPDFVSSACSSSSYFSSSPVYVSRGLPPKDLSWPHPKPPISPPMSSHDRPPPLAAPFSAARSSSSSDGVMSTTTATTTTTTTVTVSFDPTTATAIGTDGTTTSAATTAVPSNTGINAISGATESAAPAAAAAAAATAPVSRRTPPVTDIGSDAGTTDTNTATAAGMPANAAENNAQRPGSSEVARSGTGFRQQLPSLSDLFGPPESIRPLQPPLVLERTPSTTSVGLSASASLRRPPGSPSPSALNFKGTNGPFSSDTPQSGPPPARAARASPPPSQLPRSAFEPAQSVDNRTLSETAYSTGGYKRARPPSPEFVSRASFPPPPPSPRTRDQVWFSDSYQSTRRSPPSLGNEPHQIQNQQPPPPPQQQQQQQQQQQRQRQEEGNLQTYRQWPDSQSGFVAVGKWSLRQHDSGGDGSPTREQEQQRQQQQLYRPQSREVDHYQQPLRPLKIEQPHSYDHHQQQQQHPSVYQQPYQQQTGPPPLRSTPPTHSSYDTGSVSDARAPPLTLPPRPSSSVSSSLPPTPATAGHSEGVPSRDGLGPKIWTGTQFLPRFVRAAEVPGEGMCYFYDDGSHCKTVIDGEAVNAHWGVTKAGKPRKRLAIACVTCREKKIKCDPDYPRCVQCEKFGRVCRFKNAPRGGNNTSPGTATSEPDHMQRMGSMPLVRPPPPESPRSLGYPGSRLMGSPPRTGMVRPANADAMATAPSNKRARTSYGPHHYPIAGKGWSPPPAPEPHTAPLMASVGSGRPSTAVLPPLVWTGTQSTPPPHHAQAQLQQHQHQHQNQHHHQHQQPHPHPYHEHLDTHQPQTQAQADAHHQAHARPRTPTPPQPDLPRLLLPPPHTRPELPRIHDDVLRRPWQSNLYG